ncbi:metallophosphoesterase [Niabella terrae]
MLLIDCYVYFALRSLFQTSSSKTKSVFTVIYWSISALAMLSLLLLPYFQFSAHNKLARSTIFALVFALFFGKLIAALFFLVDDIRRLFQWFAGKLFSAKNEISEIAGTSTEAISRSSFFSWLGIIAGGSLFTSFIYGLSNKYNYTVKRVQLSYPNLPAGFKGMKAIHISDIHTGSLTNLKAVAKGVEMILAEKADIIFFTGDLVNNRSEEVGSYQQVFEKLKAPMGVYSILGNHDYGDYEHWNSPAAKQANLEVLKKIHSDMGWRLLLDETVALQRGDDHIGLTGVQNISGKSSFHSYGDLAKAVAGSAPFPFRILLSHDPSHWDKEVNTRYPEMDLMLSGHTHGMQFGVEIPGLRWSPVQYVYKQWAGLYESGAQKLYVNRGYGFIGYPGRVGILPEITVIEFI